MHKDKALLEMRNVTVQYDTQTPMIEHFNMSIAKGEIIGIVGESGSGKTSIMRAALGALPEGGMVTRGEIWFAGESLLGKSPAQWRKLRGSQMAMIFQDCGGTLNPIRRIGSQYVEYIRTHEPMQKQQAWERAKAMLKKMRLPESDTIMNSYPHQLSGGMQQRVGIAMAMTFDPKLLLADEPTSALDVTTQAQIVREMLALRKRFATSIVLATHNLGAAAYMADRLIVMQNGEVMDAGTREEVLRHPQSTYTKKLLEAVPKLEGERFV